MRYLYEAVFAALNQIGSQTSLERLQRTTNALWMQSGNRSNYPSSSYASVLRKH